MRIWSILPKPKDNLLMASYCAKSTSSEILKKKSDSTSPWKWQLLMWSKPRRLMKFA